MSTGKRLGRDISVRVAVRFALHGPMELPPSRADQAWRACLQNREGWKTCFYGYKDLARQIPSPPEKDVYLAVSGLSVDCY